MQSRKRVGHYKGKSSRTLRELDLYIYKNVDKEKIKKSHMVSYCWIWKFSKNENEYGNIYFRGKQTSVHRVSWMLANSSFIPEGWFICHKCDTPACINPEHLYLGTNSTNVRDSYSRGNRKPTAKPGDRKGKENPMWGRKGKLLNPTWGWKNGHSKIKSDADIAYIKILKFDKNLSTLEISKIFNVHSETIRRILVGETYKNA